MGLLVHVYRDNLSDCTNGGISSKANMLCLVNVDGTFNPTTDIPAAMLVPAAGQGIVRIIPATVNENGKYAPSPGWFMMGGNYAATSDSRLREAVERLTGTRFYGAIAIHDRIEK